MTPILPYIMYYAPVDGAQPWDSSTNAKYFRSVIPEYVNPAFGRVYDQWGFALAHYAGNLHVLYPNSSVSMEDIEAADGRSQTLLVGEVNDGFAPWGAPYNFRDPGRGLNQGPDTFGGPPGQGGPQFVFADGSVRAISDQIDPAVLRALSTPAGHDDVQDFISK